MAGWRDTVSEAAQDDLDELTSAAVDFALQQINKHGGFVPFTLAVASTGDKQLLQPNYAVDAKPDAAQQFAAQWSSIHDVKSTLRAVAVAVDVAVPERNQDAIELMVEHREGVAIGMLFPYARAANGDYDVSAPSAYPEERRIWS